MAKLFETSKIKNMTLKNRSVRSATWNGMADKEGYSTRAIDALLAELAHGEVGLIISGHAYVHQDGQISPRQLGIFSDSHIDGLSRMTELVHANGGTIAVQLAHAGCHSNADLTGMEPMGPSVMKNEN